MGISAPTPAQVAAREAAIAERVRREHSRYPVAAIPEGVGVREILTVPNPGTGNQWTVTLKGGYYTRLLWGITTFSTSAVVASRVPSLSVDQGLGTPLVVPVTAALTNNTTDNIYYVGAPMAGSYGGGYAGIFGINFPNAWLEPQAVISSVTPGMDPGDSYTKTTLWVERLDYGPYGRMYGEHPASDY